MSDLEARGQKRIARPLVSGRVLPPPAMSWRQDRVDSISSSPSPVPAAVPTRDHDAFLSARLDAVQSAVQAMLIASERGIDVLIPVKDALAAIVGIGDMFQSWDAEVEFDALRRGLAVLSDSADNHAAADGIMIDSFHARLRTAAATIQQLWCALQSHQQHDPQGQPQNPNQVKSLIKDLTELLVDLTIDVKVAPEGRLATARQVSMPYDLAVTVEPQALSIVNNNRATTYNFGRDVINNNWVNNYVFSERITPDLAKKQEKTIKAIKTAIGDRFVLDALHDTQPKDSGCMVGTRTNILSKFMAWIKNDPKKILWLAGMAGTGKTSIAVTLCRMMDADPDIVLGGAFFCSRSVGSLLRREARHILPTLAASLATLSPEYAATLAVQLQADDRAVHRPISDQIATLLSEPLSLLASSNRRIIFVIDALDECDNERDLAELLTGIATFKCDANIKFILTSRPETPMLGSPISDRRQNEILQLHMIETAEITTDIRLYIEDAFSKQQLSKPWYTDADVSRLAALSEGLFIFASTIVQYVLSVQSASGRTSRLEKALSAVQNTTVAMRPLDAVYEFVLTRASDEAKVEPEELEATRKVLACILTTRMSLSVKALAELLEMETEDLYEALRRLHAVVHVPDETDLPALRTLHASFGDYLFDRADGNLRITESFGHDILARGCLRRMGWGDLRFNVSRSLSSYELKDGRLPRDIPLSLLYACMHWAHHIDAASAPCDFDPDIELYFRPKLLFWLEVLNVFGKVGLASGLLRIAAAAATHDHTLQFLRDANFFVISSREAIEWLPPHIYLSALAFAAKDSLVYQDFFPVCTGLVSFESFGIDCHGGRLVTTLTGHDGPVESIAYSPSGRFIASGSADGTVRIWDALTGEETASPLRGGHRGSSFGVVCSVSFAPDGKKLASGTDAGVVCIWNVSAGQVTPKELFGHTEKVNCVAFSTDGSLLASASSDKSVRLWRTEIGRQISVSSGHSEAVNVVAFNPNYQILASGSDDRTIRLWHSSTGRRTGEPLCGHASAIHCICFSQDGEKLASSSLADDIRVWELHTGRMLATLDSHSGDIRSIKFSANGLSLMSAWDDSTVYCWDLGQEGAEATNIVFGGHTGSVHSAAFSPDGTYVSSTSSNHSIRILDTTGTHAAVKPLSPVHQDTVSCLAVSSDGAFIVSGGHDHTVYAWNSQTGEHWKRLPPLQGHTDHVTSVSVASDGLLIASASRDHTVRLWDASTGMAIGEPLRGHESTVNVVSFSPDDSWLVSGSDDCSVQIWSASTGWMLGTSPLICAGSVITIVLSPDSQIIAAGDSTGCIYAWRTETGLRVCEPLSTRAADESQGDAIVFSPDSARIILLAEDGVTIWEISTGHRVMHTNIDTGAIESAAFSRDGQLIACGSETGVLTLWDTATGGLLATLYGHGDTIQSLVFTQDGRFIISGSWDQTIRVWNVPEALALSANGGDDADTAFSSTAIEDGWLTGRADDLLLWVPAEYRQYLQMPPCTMVIGKHRVVISADVSRLHRGENWAACWQGPLDV